jgi:VanZ family protein
MRAVFFYKQAQREDVPLPRWRWWLRVWTPVAFAVSIIAMESTSTFSARNTSGWLRPVVQSLFGALDDSTWDLVHHALRKTGHFVGYGFVCLTFIRAWLHTLAERATEPLSLWRLKSCAAAVVCTFLVACCDEAHQAMLPDRTGQFSDVLLDTAGALAVCLTTWTICWTRPRIPGTERDCREEEA